MTAPTELASLDAMAQAELVRRGEVTSLELIEAAIARVDAVNPAINAVVLKMYDQARATARAPLPAGPLSGVPFLVKDFLAEYAGVPFTEGTAYLDNYVPTEDSELIRRYKRAGLVFIGKTNTPERSEPGCSF